MLALLQRFYEVSSGRIVVDGKDLRDYDLTHLRSFMAIVSQEPVLFGSSVVSVEDEVAWSWRPGVGVVWRVLRMVGRGGLELVPRIGSNVVSVEDEWGLGVGAPVWVRVQVGGWSGGYDLWLMGR